IGREWDDSNGVEQKFVGRLNDVLGMGDLFKLAREFGRRGDGAAHRGATCRGDREQRRRRERCFGLHDLRPVGSTVVAFRFSQDPGCSCFSGFLGFRVKEKFVEFASSEENEGTTKNENGMIRGKNRSGRRPPLNRIPSLGSNRRSVVSASHAMSAGFSG